MKTQKEYIFVGVAVLWILAATIFSIISCIKLNPNNRKEELNSVFQEAYSEGYAIGNSDGFDEGFSEGKLFGNGNGDHAASKEDYSEGYSVGFSEGYDFGYDEGYARHAYDSTPEPGVDYD